MSRQRLTIGTFGDIGFLTGANGRTVARARYRDWDGKNRLVQATGDTQRAARGLPRLEVTGWFRRRLPFWWS